MHIALAFDINYLAPFYTLAASIYKNNPDIHIVIHCITRDINETEIERIKSFVLRNRGEIIFYRMDDILIRNFIGTIQGNWTIAVYYKIFFPLLVPQSLEKLIYLDTDTLVINKLDDLYNANLGKYPLGAVYDNYVRTQPEIGIIEENNYFNSGVLLINLTVWREQKITEKTIDFLNKNLEKIIYVDQDGLNAVLKYNWMHIDKKFNLIYSYFPKEVSLKTLKEYLEDKVILHFTLQRPWNMLCKNRCRYLYYHYLNLSGIKPQNRYTDFEYRKIPEWLKIRLLEFINDYQIFKTVWRKIKKILILE